MTKFFFLRINYGDFYINDRVKRTPLNEIDEVIKYDSEYHFFLYVPELLSTAYIRKYFDNLI